MSDPHEYVGRGERDAGPSIDFSPIGEPSLRVYVGTYSASFDSVDDAEAYLAAVESQVNAYREHIESDGDADE